LRVILPRDVRYPTCWNTIKSTEKVLPKQNEPICILGYILNNLAHSNLLLSGTRISMTSKRRRLTEKKNQR
jgi:hypothetical protein